MTTDITLTPSSDEPLVHAQATSEKGADFIDAWTVPYAVVDNGHITIERAAVDIFIDRAKQNGLTIEKV